MILEPLSYPFVGFDFGLKWDDFWDKLGIVSKASQDRPVNIQVLQLTLLIISEDKLLDIQYLEVQHTIFEVQS